MLQKTRQTFNDGVCTIYAVGNKGKSGGLPVKKLVKRYGPLRYEERTVSMKRYYTAMQNDEKIALVLRVPRMKDESALDVCIPADGMQYEIKQIQHPRDISPPVSDLSLERLEVSYGFAAHS